MAFAHNWKLALIMLGFTPFQAVCGFLISRVSETKRTFNKVFQSMTTLTTLETIKYSKAGKVAEEVISSIRTVVAFNGLSRESKRFEPLLVASAAMTLF